MTNSNLDNDELLRIVFAAVPEGIPCIRSQASNAFMDLFEAAGVFDDICTSSDNAENGSSIAMWLPITTSEALTGAERDVEFVRRSKCHKCGGRRKFKICMHCNGLGKIEKARCLGMFRKTIKCPDCIGTGKVINTTNCEECNGRGLITEKRNITVKVPANVRDKAVLRLSGLGDDGINEGSTGNLYLVVKIM